MTLRRFQALTDYWASYPPINVSAAAFMGIKKQSSCFELSEKKNVIVDEIELECE